MKKIIFCTLFCTTVYAVNSVEDLQNALQSNITTPSASTTINITGNILLDNTLANNSSIDNPILLPINSTTTFAPTTNSVTINATGSGSNFTISSSSAGSFRGFFVRGGTVTFANINFANLVAKGGDATIGGGGGGFGGGIHIANNGSSTNHNGCN